MPAADHINHGDQADVANTHHVHTTLGIEFPCVMRCALWLDWRRGQVTMLLIATRQFLSVEQCRDAGATWQGVIFPAGIHS